MVCRQSCAKHAKQREDWIMTRENDHHESVVLTGLLSAVALAAVGALAVAGLSVVMIGP
jgi:hypothetical protein